MAVNLSALAGAGQQFFDNSGVPLSGGKLYSYAAGTTTPQTTYTSASGSTPLANPIILDSAGRVPTGEIWLTAGSNYKFVLKTSTDTTLVTWDNITGINGTGITSNASNVTYDPAGTGAVATTAQAKMREWVSVIDFGADPTGAADSTSAFTLAIATQKVVVVPNGTYKINSPVALEASPAAGLTLVGQGGNHFNVNGAGPVVIDLTSNTQYFIALGYSPNISGLTFKNGVDVFHYSSQAIDCSICELNNVSAFNWTGYFFKGFGAGSGTHITWNSSVLLSNNTGCVVYDDATAFPVQGFDALTINDGWVEVASQVGFNTTTGRIAINDTRFVPYTSANSIWLKCFGESHLAVVNSDFGGESARTTVEWNTAGGDISFVSCGVFATGKPVLNLLAPPGRITLQDVDTDTTTSGFISNGISTAANLALFQSTVLNINGNIKFLDQYLTPNAPNAPSQGLMGLLSAKLTPTPAIVKVGDLLAVGGSSWAAGAPSGGVNATGISSPTDGLGNSAQAFGWGQTSPGAFSAYQYMNGAPGQTTIPVGEATLECLITLSVSSAKIDLFFGDNGSGVANTKSFFIGPGIHRLCFPLYVTSAMTGSAMKIGVQVQGQVSSSIIVSRLRVFAGTYESRSDNVYSTTANSAPTSSSYVWFVGDRVINQPAVAGQPKAWTCTVAAAPGTWVSEGNL